MNMEEKPPPSVLDINVCQSLEESYYWLHCSRLHDCIAYSTITELGSCETVSCEGQRILDTQVYSEFFEQPEETVPKTVFETDSEVGGVKSANNLYDDEFVEKTQSDIIVDSLSETNMVTNLSDTDEIEESESILSLTLSQNVSMESNASRQSRCIDVTSRHIVPETLQTICQSLAENYVFLKWVENCASAEDFLCKNESVQCVTEKDLEKDIPDSSAFTFESDITLIAGIEKCYSLIKWTLANASGEELLGLILTKSNVHQVDLQPSDVSFLTIGDKIENQILPSAVDNIATHDSLLISKREGALKATPTLSELSDVMDLTELSSTPGEFGNEQTASWLPSLDEKFSEEFIPDNSDNKDDWLNNLKPEHTLNTVHVKLESDSFHFGELVSIPLIGLPDASGKTRTASGLSSSDDGWSDEVIFNKNKQKYFLTLDAEVQTDCADISHQEVQTEKDNVSVEAQTEGEIVQCCQCNVYSFLSLGEQFVIRLKDEMSQRLTLEHLIKIVEKDAWIVRQELMDEKEMVISLQGEAADLKGQATHARHISSELKTRNDQLETGLEGARNMINKLEQQMSNTTYFNSGIDYMLEAKLAQGRAVEAISKVEVLQKELLHSQSEVQKLLKQLGQLSQEKNTMVSSRVHKELLQLADDKATDAELRSLKLENEVLALKEENKQLKSLSSSSESDLPFPSSSKPYKFMFTEQIDPYKEIMSMKYDMLNLHASSLSLRAESPPFSYSKATKEEKDDLKANIQAEIVSFPTSKESALPDYSDISDNLLTLTSTETPIELSKETSPKNNIYHGSSLIATGSDSEESDWSDDEVSDVTPRAPKPETLPGILEGHRIKPQVPVKPTVAPKPKGHLLHPGLMGGRSRTVSFNLLQQTEGGVSFDEAPSAPSLTVHRKPRGPQGRQPPTRFNQ